MTERITWQAEVKGLMYRYGIMNKDIAERLGLSEGYVAKLFTGKYEVKDGEDRIRAAVDDIIRERSIDNAEG